VIEKIIGDPRHRPHSAVTRQHLKTCSVMMIPSGALGSQRILWGVKDQAPKGTFTIARSDIYNGSIVPFVPFATLGRDVIKGTHHQ
jgi:protein-L-isoaspartate(D-aspartate) O-methyltransferase